MRALILDTETTGLDTSKERIIELGYRVVDENFDSTTEGDSTLMWDPSYPVLTNEVVRITGIDQDLLFKQYVSPQLGFLRLSETIMHHGPNVVICYNTAYDEAIMRAEIARGAFGLMPGINFILENNWLCAMRDNESNYAKKCWTLSHLALDYGVAVDPANLHRAMGDVELTQAMLKASGATVTKLLEFNKAPWVTLAAMTEKPWLDGGKSTDLAKKKGYSWEIPKGDISGKKFDKTWVKRVKEHLVEQEIKETSFQVSVIK